jgi:hypothetical protein
MGAIEDIISQPTFLQMTYTVENPHADGRDSTGARPCFHPTSPINPHATSPAPTTTGCREDRCPVVSKQQFHSRATAKMSPHISIGPEPVLTAHAPSPPAADSHCPAKQDSAPHCGTEFLSSTTPQATRRSPQRAPLQTTQLGMATPWLTCARAQGMRTCG